MAATFTTPNRPLTWLITGCSSGLGLSLARLVQSKGHNLIATSRNPARTPDLVAEVEKAGGKWLALDVDDKDSAKVIENLEAGGQEIDVLVNNAGYSLHAPAESFTEEEIRAQTETVYFGPYRLIRAVLPHMRKRRSGVIVNMSSGAALEGRESMGIYAAAKAALDGLSRVMAKEVAPFNIRVLTVQLGTFNTNMGNATILGKNPLPEDYKGSIADQMMQFMASGKFQGNGDKDKAVKAVYEVVVGEGVGAGREAERLLPLGRDLAARIKTVQDYYAHAIEVFGDICNNVYRDAN
ncbi:hypothetical protein MYCTH_2309487 [Thermothelomyces thermophilus ATCC 42464]|uniref:Uncharacterized protein n=1 Tax=Thermothelomyces thermophilus (strain ATCC 42464 / BCRC 31852 / DSM 1799) TaxID=573729 RepID=G2QIG2_THET4|nr:uncharacterized protein MYCTH_2309487 [Thermothelomyces thermophilus ATCC 42464]AEO60336.1 hypothetical protein MYCTH_2309487 [Thermothelomyces thermophilus ATCC 42464]